MSNDGIHTLIAPYLEREVHKKIWYATPRTRAIPRLDPYFHEKPHARMRLDVEFPNDGTQWQKRKKDIAKEISIDLAEIIVHGDIYSKDHFLKNMDGELALHKRAVKVEFSPVQYSAVYNVKTEMIEYTLFLIMKPTFS